MTPSADPALVPPAEDAPPSAINPASAQGGQSESQPSMTQVDTTQTVGAAATQVDREGRTLGSDARAPDRGGLDSGLGPGQVEGRQLGPAGTADTKPSESQP